MKPVTVHPEAEAKADLAFEYYWARSEAAAVGFDAELKKAYAKLKESPLTCLPHLYGTRRVILDPYPYSVIFREHQRGLQIVAVAHAKRRPGYWSKRLKQ